MLFLVIAAAPVAQAQVLPLEPILQGQPVGDYFHHWVDESGKATIEDVLENRAWRGVIDPVPNFGIDTRVHWFKVDVQSADDQRQWLLQVSYALLDYLDMYLVDSSGAVLKSQFGGMARPLSNRNIPHRFNLIELPNATETNFSVYLRVQSFHSLQLPVAVWTSEAFVAHDELVNLVVGTLLGCLSVMLLYNFFLYTTLRDPLYLAYVGVVISFLLLQITLKGFGYRYFWNQYSEWSSVAVYFAGFIATFFGSSFAILFLQLKQRNRLLYLLVDGVRWFSLICGLAVYWLPKQWVLSLLAAVVLSVVALGYLTIFAYSTRKDRSLRIFASAWAIFLVGVLLLLGNKLGLIAVNYWTEQTIALGTVVEMVLFSMALGDRINQEKAQTFAAKAQYIQSLNRERQAKQSSLRNEEMERQAKEITLKLQQENNLRLEREVQVRTHELQMATEKLQQLVRIDPLTKVFNRHYFNEQIETQCQRTSEQGSPLALLIVDIDHFKAINDKYGHWVGDQCIQWVAKRIQEIAQEFLGTVFRYGGEEFTVVIPFAEQTAALQLAQLICDGLATDRLEMENGPSALTVSVGVLWAKLPVGERPENVIELADQALYQAKQGGRNRVMSASYEEQKKRA